MCIELVYLTILWFSFYLDETESIDALLNRLINRLDLSDNML